MTVPSGILLASDAGFEFVILNIEVDRGRPAKHERERIEGRASVRRSRVDAAARAVVPDAKKQHVRLADRRQRA